ncbi:hypothetical protein C8R43DRAFT_1237696 [Mycena crocata]|nr:hypothetical protein C8R43DRAFT_1237696 [Mycena crocata]
MIYDDTRKLRLIKILCAHSAQWWDVKLIIPYQSFQRFTFSAGLPVLNRLVLGTSHTGGHNQDIISAFRVAGQMRQAHILLDNFSNETTPIFVLPWAQLTSFTGTSLNFAECMLVLSEATALLDCHLFDVFPGRDADSALLKPLILSSETFEMDSRDDSTSDPDLLWDALTMPRLGELTMSFPHSLQFEAFLQRSAAHLRSVTIRHPMHFHAELCTRLSFMPTISSLELESPHSSDVDEFVDFLGGGNLPHLKDVVIIDIIRGQGEVTTFSYDALLELLLSPRLDPSAGFTRLESLRFSWSAHGDEDFELDDRARATLDTLRADGMRLDIGPTVELLKKGDLW